MGRSASKPLPKGYIDRIHAGKLTPKFLFSYANINNQVGEAVIRMAKSEPELTVSTFDLYDFIVDHGWQGPECKDYDIMLVAPIALMRHKGKIRAGEDLSEAVRLDEIARQCRSGPQSSNFNGTTHEAVVRSILSWADMEVLPKQHVYGTVFYDPIKLKLVGWDAVALSKCGSVILFVEAKSQAGNGSADEKFVNAIQSVKSATYRVTKFLDSSSWGVGF